MLDQWMVPNNRPSATGSDARPNPADAPAPITKNGPRSLVYVR